MRSWQPVSLSSETHALTGLEQAAYGQPVEGIAQHPAQAELEGVVEPATGGGHIRYRVWPARRHPMRLVAVCATCVGVTAGVALAAGTFWSIFVFVGLVLGAGVFFFPTEVAMDSHTLHVRAFGTPRTWDLRHFRRFEVSRQPLPRVELIVRSGFDLLDNVLLPVPEAHGEVLDHLRTWVGRQPTGTFELDDDLVPEDTVEV